MFLPSSDPVGSPMPVIKKKTKTTSTTIIIMKTTQTTANATTSCGSQGVLIIQIRVFYEVE